MTAPSPFPKPGDKASVREWMRENSRSATRRAIPLSPSKFAAGQRERLLKSLGAAPENNAASRLDVALTGDATSTNSVRISVLAPFLNELQESVSAIAQALTGRPTAQAPLPKAVRELTALSASAIYPSSFGMVLDGPQVEAEAESPSGDMRTVLDDAIDIVLNLAEISESPSVSDDLLASELVPLGQRVVGHLGKLTASLSDADLGLRMTWRGRDGHTRRGQWTPVGAKRVQVFCEGSQFDEPETLQLVGWLVTASSLRGFVEIRTDSGEVIRAKTDESVTAQLGEFYEKRVEATVAATTVRSTGGRERKIFAVTTLRNVASDRPSA